MPDADLSSIRTEMNGILRCSVSQTLAVSDLSGLLMRQNPDAQKLEKAAKRLAQAANETRLMTQNLLSAARDLPREIP
jgi:hypothetical protein